MFVLYLANQGILFGDIFSSYLCSFALVIADAAPSTLFRDLSYHQIGNQTSARLSCFNSIVKSYRAPSKLIQVMPYHIQPSHVPGPESRRPPILDVI